MPYADSDFFLALMKDGDWLQEKAEKLLKEHEGQIWTSQWVIVEMLMVCREFGLDPVVVVSAIGRLARVDSDYQELLAAAQLIKDKGMSVFDALHAVACSSGDGKIISSDGALDRIGLERIKLEK